jgi:hypothetical protein
MLIGIFNQIRSEYNSDINIEEGGGGGYACEFGFQLFVIIFMD